MKNNSNNEKKRNYNKRGNSKSRKFNKFDPSDSENKCDNKLTGSNDFNWYNLNPDLVEKAARIPFGRPLGNAVSNLYDDIDGTPTYDNAETYFYPGIATLKMIPSVGCNDRGTQSIDVAAKSIYSWVRHANSGHANYDSPDLMIYLMAARNIYAAAGYLLKLYSCLQKYNPTNRYLPEILINTLGINPSILVENMADFRYFCAQWFKKAQVLFTPKKFPLFEKAFWMFTQLYEEDKTGKSPLYQFAPAGFYIYNATKYSTGGCLEFRPVNSAVFSTYTAFTNYFTLMLDRVINDEDMGIMSGDIKKAFGDQVWSLGDFPFDAVIDIVHDSFVLQQMHNAIPLNIDTFTPKLDIVQNNNEILWFPQVYIDQNSAKDIIVYNTKRSQILVDIDSTAPSTEEVIEATQYTNFVERVYNMNPSARYADYLTVTGYTHDPKSYTVEDASDFLCTKLVITCLRAGGAYSSIEYAMGDWPKPTQFTGDTLYRNLCQMMTFEWLPLIKINDSQPFSSLHNYTLTSSTVISNLHDCSWLSLLAIPANEHLK